jgi:TRAP-type C4-dicarboxylate transport system permease small subunit
MNVTDSLTKINRSMVVLETALAGGLLLLVFLVVLSQVLMRYLFAWPNPWSEELSRFSFIWLSMLGAAVAVERRSHFGFDQVVKRLSPARRLWARRFATAVVVAVALLLIGAGLALVRLARGQHSAALDVPMSWVYAAVPVSGLLMLIHIVSGEETG